MTRWRSLVHLAPALPLLWLAGCATPPAVVTAPEEPAAPTVVDDDEMMRRPLKNLAGRKLKPQPDRPLNVRSQCSHKDAVGTRTKLDLQVREAVVKRLTAQVSMPKRGTCRFDLQDFTQQEQLPTVKLAAKDGSDCTIRLWEQGSRTTVAFQSCAARCDAGAFDYLWPIMVETKSGRCF